VHARPSLSEGLKTSILLKPEPHPPNGNVLGKRKEKKKEKKFYRRNARSLSDAEKSLIVKFVKVQSNSARR